MQTLISTLLLLLILGNLPLSARDVEWRSELFGTNRDSAGAPLDASWTFSLGYFGGDFIPTSENSEQWCFYWVSLDVANYLEFSSRFVGVWSDTGEVPNGRRGYIWGLNRGSPAPEWILLSGTSWTFPLPAASAIDPAQKILWTTSTANDFVIGAVNAPGVHLRTAAVAGEPFRLGGEQWKKLNFSALELADPAISSWTADPDGDGYANLDEYAFGLAPTSPSTLDVIGEVRGGFWYYTVPIAQKVSVLYYGQVSSDLVQWDEGSSFVTSVGQTETSLTFRDLTPVSSAQRRFGRVRTLFIPD